MDEVKEYSLEMEDRGDYLYAAVGGQRVTAEVALAYWREITDKCRESGISKILLEHKFVEMISMQEMVTIIGPVGDLLKGRTLAFYDQYGNYDIPEAGKAILRSREVKMQLFRDLSEAERWLLAN